MLVCAQSLRSAGFNGLRGGGLGVEVKVAQVGSGEEMDCRRCDVVGDYIRWHVS